MLWARARYSALRRVSEPFVHHNLFSLYTIEHSCGKRLGNGRWVESSDVFKGWCSINGLIGVCIWGWYILYYYEREPINRKKDLNYEKND